MFAFVFALSLKVLQSTWANNSLCEVFAMAEMGLGEYSYAVAEGWGQLPGGWTFGEVSWPHTRSYANPSDNPTDNPGNLQKLVKK